MSTILGANGRPAAEPDATEEAPAPARSEVQDVRTVPMGVLLYNLILCGSGMQTNKMILDQVQHDMIQQKVIVDPPQVRQLKEVLAHQEHARNIMVGEINTRFKAVDAARMAEIEATPA